MQGQRGTIGSLPETLDFELGATSNNATIDQQICWNSMRNPPESHIQDYLLPPSDMNMAFVNSMNLDGHNMSRWCSHEASSSNTQTEIGTNERKIELGWPPSSPCAVSSARLEERRHEPSSYASADTNLNPIFAQSSHSEVGIPSNVNLNAASFVGRGGTRSQVLEFPNAYKVSGSDMEQNRSISVSDPFLLPSRRAGFSVEENDGRQSSLEGRRISCKRKAIEGHAGQSSTSASCSYFQPAESIGRLGGPAQNNVAPSSLSLYASEQGNPRLGLGGRTITSDNFLDSNVPESSRRSFRARTTSLNQPNAAAPVFSTGTGRTVRRSSMSASQSSLTPVDHSLDLRPTSVVDTIHNQSQPAMMDVPPLPQNVQSLRWNGGSSSRHGSSSRSAAFGDRDIQQLDDLNHRSLPRNMLDHPIFVPATELRNSVRHPANRSLAGPSLSIPGNVVSTPRAGSSANVHPSSAPVWASHHNSTPQHPRRFSEYLRRSLFSSVGTEPGGQRSNYLPLRPGQLASSPEVVFPPGASYDGHHLHPRSASWMERHNDNGLGLHYSLRSLGAGADGNNSRLVSEQIRNVLGLMQRGESLRFEDVMILDPSVFMGVADIHDRHRDMRLDVDNMSYEELLALEERIGNVSTGLSEEKILTHLKQKKYLIAEKYQSEAEPCCVCQEEYKEGEHIGTLECGHDFHSHCIKQWLTHKNLCPICKTTALAT
ncbi:probable E3 ubiquitin-protein ligase RHG1A isoform X1 [Cannabis sativa]|nr:probable E3 ubiquitin-protein ligase RHG1A isoform X1 [Cannabis sativa]XP_060963049.1 probable E3 ubiquitin-protein ligase RHG1A isoform X1 [Cannabis sativa]XP_060963050.1 probable E3 ubiquitin-protein ligase RHG1A isoform X1 [Cannabis sativa]